MAELFIKYEDSSRGNVQICGMRIPRLVSDTERPSCYQITYIDVSLEDFIYLYVQYYIQTRNNTLVNREVLWKKVCSDNRMDYVQKTMAKMSIFFDNSQNGMLFRLSSSSGITYFFDKNALKYLIHFFEQKKDDQNMINHWNTIRQQLPNNHVSNAGIRDVHGRYGRAIIDSNHIMTRIPRDISCSGVEIPYCVHMTIHNTVSLSRDVRAGDRIKCEFTVSFLEKEPLHKSNTYIQRVQMMEDILHSASPCRNWGDVSLETRKKLHFMSRWLTDSFPVVKVSVWEEGMDKKIKMLRQDRIGITPLSSSVEKGIRPQINSRTLTHEETGFTTDVERVTIFYNAKDSDKDKGIYVCHVRVPIIATTNGKVNCSLEIDNTKDTVSLLRAHLIQDTGMLKPSDIMRKEAHLRIAQHVVSHIKKELFMTRKSLLETGGVLFSFDVENMDEMPDFHPCRYNKSGRHLEEIRGTFLINGRNQLVGECFKHISSEKIYYFKTCSDIQIFPGETLRYQGRQNNGTIKITKIEYYKMSKYLPAHHVKWASLNNLMNFIFKETSHWTNEESVTKYLFRSVPETMEDVPLLCDQYGCFLEDDSLKNEIRRMLTKAIIEGPENAAGFCKSQERKVKEYKLLHTVQNDLLTTNVVDMGYRSRIEGSTDDINLSRGRIFRDTYALVVEPTTMKCEKNGVPYFISFPPTTKNMLQKDPEFTNPFETVYGFGNSGEYSLSITSGCRPTGTEGFIKFPFTKNDGTIFEFSHRATTGIISGDLGYTQNDKKMGGDSNDKRFIAFIMQNYKDVESSLKVDSLSNAFSDSFVDCHMNNDPLIALEAVELSLNHTTIPCEQTTNGFGISYDSANLNNEIILPLPYLWKHENNVHEHRIKHGSEKCNPVALAPSLRTVTSHMGKNKRKIQEAFHVHKIFMGDMPETSKRRMLERVKILASHPELMKEGKKLAIEDYHGDSFGPSAKKFDNLPQEEQTRQAQEQCFDLIKKKVGNVSSSAPFVIADSKWTKGFTFNQSTTFGSRRDIGKNYCLDAKVFHLIPKSLNSFQEKNNIEMRDNKWIVPELSYAASEKIHKSLCNDGGEFNKHVRLVSHLTMRSRTAHSSFQCTAKVSSGNHPSCRKVCGKVRLVKYIYPPKVTLRKLSSGGLDVRSHVRLSFDPSIILEEFNIPHCRLDIKELITEETFRKILKGEIKLHKLNETVCKHDTFCTDCLKTKVCPTCKKPFDGYLNISKKKKINLLKRDLHAAPIPLGDIRGATADLEKYKIGL